jgi:hypothetical protein
MVFTRTILSTTIKFFERLHLECVTIAELSLFLSLCGGDDFHFVVQTSRQLSRPPSRCLFNKVRIVSVLGCGCSSMPGMRTL